MESAVKERAPCPEVTSRSSTRSADVTTQVTLPGAAGLPVPKGPHRHRLSVTGAKTAVVSRGRSGYQGRSRGSTVTSWSRRLVASSRASSSEEEVDLRQSFLVSSKGENSVFDCGSTAGAGEVGARRGGKGAGPRQGARKRLGFQSSKRARSSVSDESCLQRKRPRPLTDVTNHRLEKCKCSLAGPRVCVVQQEGSKGISRPPLVALAPSFWQCRASVSPLQSAVASCSKCASDLESLGGEEDENTPPLRSNLPTRHVPPKRRKRLGHALSGHTSLSHVPSIRAFFRATKSSHGPATDRLKKRSGQRDGDFANGGGVEAVTSTPVKSVDLEKLDTPLTSSPMEIESVRGRLSAMEDHSLSKSDLGIADASSSCVECNMSVDFGAISFRNVANDCCQTRTPQFLEMLPSLGVNESESSVFISPCNNLSSADADLEPVASNNYNDKGPVMSNVPFQPSLLTKQTFDVSSVDVETVEYPASVSNLPTTKSGKFGTISIDHERLPHVSVETRNSSASEAVLRRDKRLSKLAASSMLLRASSSEVLGSTPISSPREDTKKSPWTFETALSRLSNNQSPMSVHTHFPQFLQSDLRKTNDSDSPTTFPNRCLPLKKRPSPLTLALTLESPASASKLRSVQLAFSSSSSSSSSTSLGKMPKTKFDFSNLSSDSSSSSSMAQLESSVGKMTFGSADTFFLRNSESQMAVERKRKLAAKPPSLTLSPLPLAMEGVESDPPTPNTLRIQVAVDAFQRQGNVVGDASKTYSLPAVPGPVSSVTYVTPEVVRDLLRGSFADNIPGFEIYDCRYPYEFNGGHIKGAINAFKKEQILAIYEERARSGADWQKHVLIFHCEFSSERGPSLCRMLREHDRKRNADRYPQLLFPEIYVLQGGYNEFFETFPDLCEPRGYTKMWRKEYKEELRHFRAKSHTWPSPKGAQSGCDPTHAPQRPSTAPDCQPQGDPQGCGQHLDVS